MSSKYTSDLPRTKRLSRTISCLETFWDSKIENRLNVVPILEISSKALGTTFRHLSCNTGPELEYNLRLLGKRKPGILYLAMHGIPGNICLHNGKNISLDELADLMENRFMNWFVHFGSCSTLRSYAAAERFASRTGAKMVSGFTKDVNWVESAAFELLLFELLQERQSAKIIARQVWSRYGELAERNGFICFPEHLRPGQA